MKYNSNHQFSHSQMDKVGVLITNLGTPDAPTKKALKRYLKEFLSDPRVVEVPRLIWWCVLNFIILNFRPKRSAHAYSTVWQDEGSPLLIHTRNQAVKLKASLQQQWGEHIEVDFAMRYGSPAISDVVDNMLQKGVRKLLVLPLYPQYCASTTASTFDALASDFMQRRWIPELRFITHYHDHEEYINVLANKIKQHWDKHGQAEKLIMSYHGIPKRYLLNGDPYHCECHKTSRLLAQKLGLTQEQYITTFQSRFGKEEWLRPYTDETLKSLADQGTKFVQLVCPGFSADCLETIEEIGVENRDYFMRAGGQKYEYIEALNSDDQHIEMLKHLVVQHIQGWQVENQIGNRQALAREKGAQQ